MSGHSKWSKVKHQKATTDVVKAKAFTKASHAITVAVREGGGVADPNGNFRLRLAIEKAREVNMPKENIDRAIAKGRGDGGHAIESLLYEAYGPSGMAMLIEATTENRQRTVSMVKHALDRNGGILANPGSVSYQFVYVGVIVVNQVDNPDQLLEISLECGATDVVFFEESAEIYSEPKQLETIRETLENKGYIVDNSEIVYRSTMPAEFDEATTLSIDHLVDALTELDDVQHVYTNVK